MSRDTRTSWQSAALAPLYALLISFALVSVVGYAVGSTGDDGLTHIRFVVGGGAGAVALSGTAVAVLPLGESDANGENGLDGAAPAGVIDPTGTLILHTPSRPYRVCAVLPKGWRAPDAMVLDSGERCWVRTARDTDVDLTVLPPEVPR